MNYLARTIRLTEKRIFRGGKVVDFGGWGRWMVGGWMMWAGFGAMGAEVGMEMKKVVAVEKWESGVKLTEMVVEPAKLILGGRYEGAQLVVGRWRM
ncbi:MAG: hypothetical protein NTX04_01180 [Verrucomicrobia bacterium]|nr:hypothetical protein [Verrucomicrobiota bacterium]